MPVTFKNRNAVFLWGFAVCWVGMLCAMTWVTVRDGPPPGNSPVLIVGVMGFFWAAGIGLIVHVAAQATVRVDVLPLVGVRVTQRYPYKVVRREFPRSALSPAIVVGARDDEGDPYFYARLITGSPPTVDFAESHARSHCEAACARFNAALFGTRVSR